MLAIADEIRLAQYLCRQHAEAAGHLRGVYHHLVVGRAERDRMVLIAEHHVFLLCGLRRLGRLYGRIFKQLVEPCLHCGALLCRDGVFAPHGPDQLIDVVGADSPHLASFLAERNLNTGGQLADSRLVSQHLLAPQYFAEVMQVYPCQGFVIVEQHPDRVLFT